MGLEFSYLYSWTTIFLKLSFMDYYGNGRDDFRVGICAVISGHGLAEYLQTCICAAQYALNTDLLGYPLVTVPSSMGKIF